MFEVLCSAVEIMATVGVKMGFEKNVTEQSSFDKSDWASKAPKHITHEGSIHI